MNISYKKPETPTAMAVRTLSLEYKNLQEEPVEGFRVKLGPGDDLLHWEVGIFGPPNTLYEGGYFKALMTFPTDYPYSPPSISFQTKLWHPNVYEDGDLCISILHPPIEDNQAVDTSQYGELPCERWNPTQTVRTILLSVISLLNEPNTFSPANVDASVMYRRWKESQGADKEYESIIKKQVIMSRMTAEAEGIKIPTTLEEYCCKPVTKTTSSMDLEDYYVTGFDEDDIYSCDDDDEDVDSGVTEQNGIASDKSEDTSK